MTIRQCLRHHRLAAFLDISARQYRQVLPTLPVDSVIFFENGIKALLVERHMGAGMMQKLTELTALIGENCIWQANTGFPVIMS